MMSVASIKAKVERLWSRGELCRAAVGHSDVFPWSLSLGKPSSKQMLDDFSGTQAWAKEIQVFAHKKNMPLQWQSINHRALGAQHLPSALYMETPQQAASMIGKSQQLKQFMRLYQTSIKALPALQPWLLQYPLKVLDFAHAWQKILDLCVWMQSHPHPHIYLRQVDVAGVDSKFIEQHRRILASLFDIILPGHAIDDDFSGAAGFARRYGFLDKPTMIRLRPLDKAIALLHSDGNQDVMMTDKSFATLDNTVLEQIKRVVIVENEVNYLAFPDMEHTLLIFGSGYGFEALKKAAWLHERALYYWGDLDTHGFAILNQLRAHIPHVQSFLMDEVTLLQHQASWGREPKQEKKALTHLSAEEQQLYDKLRTNHFAENLRLEQEHIRFSYVMDVVQHINKGGRT